MIALQEPEPKPSSCLCAWLSGSGGIFGSIRKVLSPVNELIEGGRTPVIFLESSNPKPIINMCTELNAPNTSGTVPANRSTNIAIERSSLSQSHDRKDH